MAERIRLTMDAVRNIGIPSQQDMELFRRVMRVMNVLQNRTSNNFNQLFLPSAPRGLQPTFSSELESDQPMMAGGMAGGIEDEDELSDDSDEDITDDDDDEDDNDEEDYDEESISWEGDEEEDDGEDMSGEGDEEDDDDDDCIDEDDFSDDENNEDGDGGDNSHIFTYRDELPLDNLTDMASYQQLHTPIPAVSLTIPGRSGTGENDGDVASLCCWEHGCNGRKFTTRSNLRRHLREKSRARPTCRCPQCGAVFSRTTARNTHVARGSCNRIRRYSNGRVRPNLRIRDS